MNYDDAINALKTLLEGTYDKADLLNLARVGRISDNVMRRMFDADIRCNTAIAYCTLRYTPCMMKFNEIIQEEQSKL